MENIVKIEQIDRPYSSKMDATIRISQMVEVAKEVTFLGILNQIAAIIRQQRAFEADKEELIDLCASIATAQTYSQEEITVLDGMVMLDAETKAEILARILTKVDEKVAAGSIEIVGELDRTSIIATPEEPQP